MGRDDKQKYIVDQAVSILVVFLTVHRGYEVLKLKLDEIRKFFVESTGNINQPTS